MSAGLQTLIGLAPSLTDWKPMARKTNYGFERREREKARAAKKAERQRLKQEKSDERKDDGTAETAPETTEGNNPPVA